MFKNLSNILRDFKNYFFPDSNPFGNKILASKDYYLSIYEKAKKEKFLEIDILENSTGFNVDKLWLDKLALHTQVVKKKSAINYQHGRVLYSLLRKYIQDQNINYIKILEIGTARGFSSICMSKAINDTGIKGVINTIDIIPHKKTCGLPIGLENTCWKGCDYQICLQNKNNHKKKLVYINFSDKTNSIRKQILLDFQKKRFSNFTNKTME